MSSNWAFREELKLLVTALQLKSCIAGSMNINNFWVCDSGKAAES